MADDKRCGTCRWFVPVSGTKRLGDCNCPLPISVDGDSDVMDQDDGTTCPCWQPKEDGDE